MYRYSDFYHLVDQIFYLFIYLFIYVFIYLFIYLFAVKLNILAIKKFKSKHSTRKKNKKNSIWESHSCLQMCSNCASGCLKRLTWEEKLWKFWENFEMARENCSRDRKIRDTDSFLLWSSAKWQRDRINCSR